MSRMPRVKENLLFNLVMDRLSQIYFLSANYVKVGYFRHLFLSSILATFFVLVIVYGTQIDLASPELVNTTSIIWKKTAFIGFWSTCASAAGILGMARYQGVLSAILSSPRGGSSAIIMLIAPPTVFGALAFPVAYLLTSLWFYQLVSINMLAIFYSIMIICVGFIMTIPIATIFLISRHALHTRFLSLYHY